MKPDDAVYSDLFDRDVGFSILTRGRYSKHCHDEFREFRASPMLMPADPEPEFVLRVVRQIGNESVSDDRLDEIIRSNPDWDEIVSLSSRHGLVPIVDEVLDQTSVPVPQDITQMLRAQRRDRGIRNLRYVRRLHDIVDVFRDHDLRVIPYKGPVVAQAAYDDVSRRYFSDLDILVAEDDVVHARDLLQRRGYEQTNYAGVPPEKLMGGSVFRWGGEFHLVDNQDEIRVELRYQFVGNAHSDSKRFIDFWQRRTSLEVAGQTLPALSPEDRVLVLLAHGTKHGWCRLSWICDIALLIQQELDWDVILERATQYGWKSAVLLGLALISELTNVELPQYIRENIIDDFRANWGSSVLDTLYRIDPSGERLDLDPWTIIAFLNNSPRDSFAELLDVIFSPWERDYEWVSLPPKLYPLYYLLRPIRISGAMYSKLMRRFEREA